MEFLTTQFKNWLIKQEEKNEEEGKKKETFWPSENGSCKRLMYWRWMNEKSSNPPSVEGLQIMRTGKKIEDQLVEDWDSMGITVPPPKGEEQHRIDIIRNGIKISGKIDAIIKEQLDNGTKLETPIEVKSFYGDYQERLIEQLNVNEGYITQLAIYMDALDKKKGILYMVNRGNGRQFQFIINKYNNKEYGLELLNNKNIYNSKRVIDLEKVYAAFADTYKYVKKKKLPPPDYMYKYPLTFETLIKTSNSDISNARQGRKVLGDWQCKYCSYKDKCVKEQNLELGYTEEELSGLVTLTKGYTQKNWKKEIQKIINIKNNKNNNKLL